MEPDVEGLRTEYLFTIIGELDFGSLHQFGETPLGTRRIGGIAGGTFNGPKLAGQVLPGFGDWMVVRDDGTSVGDIRMALQTDGGELILASYKAKLKITPEVHARLRSGGAVDPSEYYLRSSPSLETASLEHGWLNDIVTVGRGTITDTGFTNTVFAVL